MKRQFPCILKGSYVWLAFDKGNAITLDSDHGANEGNINFEHEALKNITHEYLANTYGKVESKEHAEFIVELAKVNDIEIFNEFESGITHFIIAKGELIFTYGVPTTSAHDRVITIPMPPKGVEVVDEWPMVGDEVVVYDIGFDREITMIYRGKNKNNASIVEFENGNVILLGFEGKIKKPKTPEEELRDELSDIIKDLINIDASNNAFVDMLMEKYNITKKQ